MKRIIALFAACLLFSAAASAEVYKDEVIYANLSSDGALTGAFVVNAFEAGEAGEYQDAGDYASVDSLTPGLDALLEDGQVALVLPEGRSYYQGAAMSLELPWAFGIAYALDGNAVEADALAGRSGQFEMVLSIAQNPDAAKGWYEAYALQVTATLDADVFGNVSAENATVSAVGGSYAVSWIVLPGQGGELVLHADVREFRMEPVQIAGVRLMMDVDAGAYTSAFGMLKSGADLLVTSVAGVESGLGETGEAVDGLTASVVSLNADMETLLGKLEGDEALHGELAALIEGYRAVAGGLEGIKTGVDGAKSGVSSAKLLAEAFSSGIGNTDIDGMIQGMFGGEFAMRSFVTGEEGGARSVQFVILTPDIR